MKPPSVNYDDDLFDWLIDTNGEPKEMYYLADDTVSARAKELDMCRQVWAAVLIQAIDDANIDITSPYFKLLRPGEKALRIRIKESAINWFKSNIIAVNSFLGICHTLSFDADSVRKRILSKIIKHDPWRR